MDDRPQSDTSIADEFRNLGQNLMETLRAAWESPERKKLQEEIEDGLDQLGKTIRQETESFTASPSGKQLKSDLDDLHQRVRSGEAEAKLREEVLKALQMVNAELKKVTTSWGASQGPSEAEPPTTGEDKPPAPEA